MSYSIENPRNPNLENTAVPNLFITDFMPDVPDGDFVKVYIYAYMYCSLDIALTHAELADRLGLDISKVISAWRYFEERRIVKLTPLKTGSKENFDVEFVDVKGLLYGGNNGNSNAASGTGQYTDPSKSSLSDSDLAELFRKISSVRGDASLDGGDAQRVISWIEHDGATPEIIEFAWAFSIDERGEKSAGYVEKIVREWAGKGLKTVSEVREYRAKNDARSRIHKKLMEALGLRYSVITSAEEKKFNLWLDDYGYTPDRLFELAEKTAGVGNKFKYLEGIIRKEREAEDKAAETGTSPKMIRGGMKSRNEYYRLKRQKNEDAAAARLEEVYAAVPEAKQEDEEISLLNIELVKTLTSGKRDKKNAIDRLDKEIKAAAERRGRLLEKAGFAPDYTDIHFDCERCRDTGVLENGTSCDCCKII